MEIIKNVVAVIGVALVITTFIIDFYKLVMDDDKKEKMQAFINVILQIIMLYGGYRMISFF